MAVARVQEGDRSVARQRLDALLDPETFDPIRGQALFPFLHKKKLAWFLYDLFEEHPLRYWRYQDDPVDVRRPVAPSEGDLSGS